MVLDKLPVPGRPTNLDWSRTRAYCACSRCGLGLFGHFFSLLSCLSSFSLSLGDDWIYTEILSQRAVKPKTTNLPTTSFFLDHCYLLIKYETSLPISHFAAIFTIHFQFHIHLSNSHFTI